MQYSTVVNHIWITEYFDYRVVQVIYTLFLHHNYPVNMMVHSVPLLKLTENLTLTLYLLINLIV